MYTIQSCIETFYLGKFFIEYAIGAPDFEELVYRFSRTRHSLKIVLSETLELGPLSIGLITHYTLLFKLVQLVRPET